MMKPLIFLSVGLPLLAFGGVALTIASLKSVPQKAVLKSRAKNENSQRTPILRRSSDRDEFVKAQRLDAAGDDRNAEVEYKKIIEDNGSFERGHARLSYGQMLLRQGKNQEAASIVKPLIFTGGPASVFDAVQIYETYLRASGGDEAIRAFRNSIRDNKLDGFTLRYYNENGLSDQEAIDFIAGSWAFGRNRYKEAEKDWMKAATNYPSYPQLYADISEALFRQHKQAEVRPIFERWYLHSDDKTRAYIKAHCFLDFKRLDASLRP